MRAVRHHRLTVEDYLALERATGHKYEFLEGLVVAMAGGTPRHNALAANALRALGNRLEGRPCNALSSDQRIRTPEGLYTYADGSVFCGEIAVGPEATASNPVLLVEVLSDGTREYDRGEKLERYRGIESLRHVLLIEQDGVDVEHWFRGPDGWRREVHTDVGGAVALAHLAVELPLREIYAGVERLP